MKSKIFYSILLMSTIIPVASATVKTIHLKKGETVQVELPSNPSTGFSWAPSSLHSRNTMLEIEELPYQAQNTGLVGSGGRQVWNIAGKKRGTAHIKFEYKRPWEKGVRPAKIERFEFIIQ
jgi:inhibitor of cysteine peptidase